MTKVELFELMRRDHELHGRSIRWISREYGVHRRQVRQALKSAVPPARKTPEREPPVLTDAMRNTVRQWLQSDETAPRKQRHTGRRIFHRLQREHQYRGAESTVRRFVDEVRRARGLVREAFVPLAHMPGDEAEVDWYEAVVRFPGGERKVQVLEVRARYSGREFHMAFPRQTQLAFLEGLAAAFTYFGGVFHRVRFDNLGSAVKKVLRGRRRLETDRFQTFRSHDLFESEFCRPGKAGAHEKGGVEGGVGRYRRNHLVPVPEVTDFGALNAQLRRHCAADDQRVMEGRSQTVLAHWDDERSHLLPLPSEPFDVAELASPRVDKRSRVRVRTNWYSVPVRFVGRQVSVRVTASHVEALAEGRVVARHERLYTRHDECLELDHYLELLQLKPHALRQSRPLQTARRAGRFPAQYQVFWDALVHRHGEARGAREMVEVLMLHRTAAPEDVRKAVEVATEAGCTSASLVAMFLRQVTLQDAPPPPPLEDVGRLNAYERPPDTDMGSYDALLTGAQWGVG